MIILLSYGALTYTERDREKEREREIAFVLPPGLPGYAGVG
jgi:hypothetical protein